MIGQGWWRCEGVGGPLVGQGHAHGARGWTEAQGAVIKASMANGGEAGGCALVQLTVACQGVPPGTTAATRVGH